MKVDFPIVRMSICVALGLKFAGRSVHAMTSSPCASAGSAHSGIPNASSPANAAPLRINCRREISFAIASSPVQVLKTLSITCLFIGSIDPGSRDFRDKDDRSFGDFSDIAHKTQTEQRNGMEIRLPKLGPH